VRPACSVSIKVADDQQGRVQECLAVELELAVSFLEVLVLALVFPAEAVLFPDIGPALLRSRPLGETQQSGILDHAFLEAEEIVA
jgi:hypothetical protein